MSSKFEGRSFEDMGFSGQELKGRVAVVTGGGRGIGRELCIIMACLGADVVVAEVSPSGEETADIIRQAGGSCLYIRTDVSDEKSVAAMAEEVNSKFGPAHILVNNAIYCPVDSILEMDVDKWDRVIGVNLRGAFLCTKYLLRGMVDSNYGTIVNMISAPSMPYLAAYTCTKQAVESLAHSLAGELEGKEISVIAYGAGMVDTPGGTDAFRKLAGIYGMNYEDFTNSGINPGYDGLIPPYDSALALAYVVTHSQQYHNQTIIMHEVIEKMIPTGDYGNTVQISESEGLRELCSRALESSVRISDMVKQTDDEFNKLPFFARPMARGGFKGKSGISIGDLKDMLVSMTALWRNSINAIEEEDSDKVDMYVKEYMGRYGRMKNLLPGIMKYYREVPGETARFIKDKEALEEITRISIEREEAFRDYSNILKEIESLTKI